MTTKKQMAIRKRIRPGFTLVDVVITVLIIGVMAAIAVPKFAGTLDRHRADAAATRVQADLNLARATAIAQSKTIAVQFSPGTDDYLLPDLSDPDHPNVAYGVKLGDSPYLATLVSATLGGDTEIKYDRFGIPDSSGTIIVRVGDFQRNINIDSDTGQAMMP